MGFILGSILLINGEDQYLRRSCDIFTWKYSFPKKSIDSHESIQKPARAWGNQASRANNTKGWGLWRLMYWSSCISNIVRHEVHALEWQVREAYAATKFELKAIVAQLLG